MTPINVLCIAIDGWHAGYVGAYGNTHLATPGVDRWAAASVVCDRAFGTAQSESGTAIWDWPVADVSLAKSFAAAGYRTALVTDDEEIASGDRAAGFDECVRVPYRPATRLAGAVEGTQLFRVFAALADAIADATNDANATGANPATSAETQRPFFICAHSRAMNATWDAPYALRRQFVDEDDPDPPRDVRFHSRRLADDVDPDELLGLRAAYAGQIAVLDECLAALDDLLAETGLGQRTLVALVGVRGYPLGEHGVFGLSEAPLHEELLHVPWIVRFPANRYATLRLPQLVCHADLSLTLLDACGLSEPAHPAAEGASLMPLIATEAGPWRDRICHRRGDEETIVTPAWRLRRITAPGQSPGERMQLYVKPDDRWEVNDVASRCRDVAERLAAALQETHEAARRGESPRPLDDVLRDGL
ncbi:MAG: sulfatase-like hydrolase/transferase [Pirellulales bacterium]